MLNHFRTLLLNKPADGDVHIPESYREKPLSPIAGKLWALLFGNNVYRNNALAHAYLNLVLSSGNEAELTKYDSRISYPLTEPKFFDFNQIANPEYSNLDFPIFVTGEFTNGYLPNSTADNFQIRQVSNSSVVRIFSNGTGKYITEVGLEADPQAANIALTFNGNLSQVIQLFNTGLAVQFGKGSTAFTASPGKSWNVAAKAPLNLELENRIANFTSVEFLDDFKLLPAVAKPYVQQAATEQILIRKFAQLLCGLVSVINEL